jgi:hypothetical protein
MAVSMDTEHRKSGSTLVPGKSQAREDVNACIHRRLKECSYGFYFNQVSWQFDGGQLRLVGRVPTFYLKQMLQTILRDIDHVEQIINDVHVVSATGLSSCRPK